MTRVSYPVRLLLVGVSCLVILFLRLLVLVFDNGVQRQNKAKLRRSFAFHSHVLNCFYFNPRITLNKLTDLFLLQREDFDIILISETWLSDSISDALLSLESAFNVFRPDRVDGFMGGEVTVLARNNFYC